MRIVVLGAGISGHTAALVLREKLSREHEVLVVTPNKKRLLNHSRRRRDVREASRKG